ncbi:FeoB-associated Cys-rich membrane protein [Peribacillus deserti]|uniref:FeoB-associated Cys-rich membrane protein n=1 Tax=Peribacillus deserti TaxID=673318 RepID=A0A2N5M9V7_9BACI|nr:FeoB-associated Cys-rich membrane protein [Peribacillus deserti]PLT31139.1 FeoB-associated Cys-rich membrane protein [Peribacillus deserti]
MIINLLIGAIIFGYAGFTLYKHVVKSRQGKCAACSLSKNCKSACSAVQGEPNMWAANKELS